MATRKYLLRLGTLLLVVLTSLFAVSACGGDAGDQVATTTSGDAIPLAYTFNAGDSWGHEMITITKGAAPDGVESTVPFEETTKVLVTTMVQDVKDDVATLTMIYETLEKIVDGEAQPFMDGDIQEITMKVDQTGKIISGEGASEDEAASDFFFSGQLFAPADFSSQFSILYPESGEAKVGEEWSRTSTVPLLGMDQQLTIVTKGVLTGVATENGRDIATIDYSIALPLDVKLDLGEMLGGLMGEGMAVEELAFVMAIGGNLEYTGTAQVDRATGQTISSDGSATMVLEMSIVDAAEDLVPLDQRGPFSSNMTMTMTMREVEPGSNLPAPDGDAEADSGQSSMIRAEDLSSTIVLPDGWTMDQALTAADVEAVVGRTGYVAWPEADSKAQEGKPAGSFYDGDAIETKILFRVYASGGQAEYERLTGFVENGEEAASDLWDKMIVGDAKLATYPLVQMLVLRGDTCMSVQWRPEHYGEFDRLDLGARLADLIIVKLFKAE